MGKYGLCGQEGAEIRFFALVNMVGHCGRSKSQLSQQYFDALVDVDDLHKGYRRIFLCGEGYNRNREMWSEINRYDVAMLFDATPLLPPFSTDLLYFNPHVRSGVNYIKREHGRAFVIGQSYQKYLIAIFISNCDRKLLRNEYINKVIDMHKVDEPKNHVKSFGACFAVPGDRTNLKNFYNMKMMEVSVGSGRRIKSMQFDTLSLPLQWKIQ